MSTPSASWSAMEYRAEVARVIHQAAAQGLIPARFEIGRMVTDLSRPAECCYLVDRLLRADTGRRWAYVAALQPELGRCITILRQMEADEDRWAAARAQALSALRARTAGRDAVPMYRS